jgi:hypothetical protein
LEGFFSDVVNARFCWGFWQKWAFCVVNWWCNCDELRGERGGLAACFLGLENAPRLRGLFFGVPVLGM